MFCSKLSPVDAAAGAIPFLEPVVGLFKVAVSQESTVSRQRGGVGRAKDEDIWCFLL